MISTVFVPTSRWPGAAARIFARRSTASKRCRRGVLYFPDGRGIYPAKRPPFEVAFLFLEDGTQRPEPPPWAMRLVLQPEEFLPAAAPAAPDWLAREPDEMPEL